MSHIIHFPDDFLQNIAEWGDKGFANLDVTQEGFRYRLSFFDLANVRQGLEEAERRGRVHFTEPGMVAIEAVTENNIRQAVKALVDEKFFDTLKPVSA
jgi:hypothetical protein